jgi:tetratricopeptide (TPR) repeat protein
MLTYFNKILIIYWFTEVITAIAVIALGGINRWSTPKWVIAMIFLMIIDMVVLEIYARKEHLKLLNILFDECDAKAYMEKYYPLMKRKRNTILHDTMMANLAIGYSAIGDIESAINIMHWIEQKQRSIKPRYYNIYCTFYINTSTYYLKVNNVNQSSIYLNKAKELLSKIDKKVIYDRLKKAVCTNEAYTSYLMGEYQNALEYYLKSAEMPTNRYEEVLIHESLAKIYKGLGNTEKQIEHRLFVAKYGNTLKIAEDARVFLDGYQIKWRQT